MTDTQTDPIRRWPEPVLFVLETLESAGYEAYLVGGSVRDMLLGRPVHDFDIATDAKPEDVCRLFERTVATGIQHGTVTVLAGEMAIEVTTYRIENGYSDGRRPDAVTFTRDLRRDLARRDFTINAMAMDVHGNLVDPYQGQEDLSRRLLRAVGKPADRFAEDALRILRGVRLAAELGLAVEEDTLAGMVSAADQLHKISRERIGQELQRLFQADWWHILPWFSRGPWLSVLPSPWPDLQPGVRWLAQHTAHSACWKPTLNQATAAPEAVLCASVVTWVMAAGVAPELGTALARAVAWPNRIGRHIRQIGQLARDLPRCHTEAQWRQCLYGHRPADVVLAAAVYDGFPPAESASAQKPLLTSAVQYCQTQPLWTLRDLAVSGHDVAALGAEGPDIGQVLNELAVRVLRGQIPNQREALLATARQVLEDRKHQGLDGKCHGPV